MPTLRQRMACALAVTAVMATMGILTYSDALVSAHLREAITTKAVAMLSNLKPDGTMVAFPGIPGLRYGYAGPSVWRWFMRLVRTGALEDAWANNGPACKYRLPKALLYSCIAALVGGSYFSLRQMAECEPFKSVCRAHKVTVRQLMIMIMTIHAHATGACPGGCCEARHHMGTPAWCHASCIACGTT